MMPVMRASPSNMRKSLEMTDSMRMYGIDFVPIPVTSPEHREKLVAEALQSIADLVELAEDPEKSNQ